MDYQEVFLRFLTEQGLLPAQITRFFYSHPEIKPDIHFIANILYNRDDVSAFGSDVPKDLLNILSTKPFAADSALSNWLKDASKILEILKAKEIFDNIEVPEIQIKWAMGAFIKSCPLVDEKTKEHYITQIENTHHNNLNDKNYFVEQREKLNKFKEYMTRQGFKDTTITLYISAINQISKKYYDNLWAVSDVSLLDNVLQKLCASNEAPKKIRHFKAALNQFYSFLANKSGKNIRQHGSTTSYENNLVGFCFSCDYRPLFPELNQTEALGEAAKKLKIPFNTLKNIMSYFDYYMADNDSRKGWAVASEKMKDNHKEILDKYATNIQGKYYKDSKKMVAAYTEAKKILELN